MGIKYIERDLEKQVLPWLNRKEIICIRGPRQAGKTTFVNHLMDVLLSKNTAQEQITYISFEDILERNKLEQDPKQYITKYIDSKNIHYFIFDEVQYIKEAGHILKLICDSFNNVKLIVTGSSSLDLNKVGSYLVGRVIFFELYPFSFSEFLCAKDKKLYQHYLNYKIDIFKLANNNVKKSVFITDLNNYLKEYLLFGGYPKVVLEPNIELKKTLLKNLFYTYVEKDIVNLYGNQYKDKIVKLLTYISSCISDVIVYDDIVKNTGLYFEETKNIISILEETYVVKRISPFFRNKITEMRKNPKIYFYDFGLRNVLLDSFNLPEEIVLGKLLENYIFINLINKNIVPNFWQTKSKAEIDFVISKENVIIAIESKKVARTGKGLWSFYDEYSPKYILLTDFDKYNIIQKENKIVYVVPFVMF